MTGKRIWIGLLVAALLAAGGYYFLFHTQAGASLRGQEATPASGQVAQTGQGQFVPTGADAQQAAPASTVRIQPANTVLGQVSASGNIELIETVDVAMEVSGRVKRILVQVGDQVAAGDVLLTLDTTELERAVRRAELAVESQKNQLEELRSEVTPADIAVAEAELASARENLAQVLAGPTQEEINAARNELAAAQARYQELIAGPSEYELTQLSADLKKKEIALQEAQRAYDQVAWRNDAAASSQAATLQQATIDYEAAAAAYAQATEPATASERADALAAVLNAQHALDLLLQQPTPADIASAEAAVAQTEANLETLKAGPSATDLRAAEIALEQALIDLQEAYEALGKAQVTAPMDGTVLSVNVTPGQQVSQGAVVMTMADTTQLQLTIDVAEVDIPQVSIGQRAEIQVDALIGQQFIGQVTRIAPASDSTSGVVNYPVTIQLLEGPLDQVRPGMTAVATLASQTASEDNEWLVPSNAIQNQNGTPVILVVRNGQTLPVQVTPGRVQGEWTVVQSDELQLGDEVVGSVASFTNQESNFRFGGPGGPIPGGGRALGGGRQ